MAVGALIGFAVFMMPGDLFLRKGGPLGTVIGLAIAFCLVAPIAYSYGYMLRKYPLTGGSFTFTLIAFSGKHRKQHAFVSAWFLAIAYWSLLCLNAVGAGLVLRYIFPGVFSGPLLYEIFGWPVYLGEVIISYILIIAFSLINLKGMKTASGVQNAVVIVLVSAILIMFVGVLLQNPDLNNLNPPFPSSKTPFEAIVAIAAMSPWLYMGFDTIPQAAEEYNFTPRKAFGLMLAAMCSCAAAYLILMFIAGTFMPWEDMLAAGNFWNIGWAVEEWFGYGGLLLCGLAMMLGIFSGINAFFQTSSRVLFAMGRVDALPKSFGKVNKNGVPSTAIIFIMITALFAPFLGRAIISIIVDMLSLGMGVCYTYSALSSAIIARRNGDKLPQVLGIFAACAAIFCCALCVIPSSPGFLSYEAIMVLIIWVILGIIMYIINRKNYMSSTKIDELAAEAEAESKKIEEAMASGKTEAEAMKLATEAAEEVEERIEEQKEEETLAQ